ncbi:MAG: hypothetical protein O4803_14110 [Trichodesmium sp. St15_bin1_1]|nr:hypothetical protein [Trichodesmium sp. St7_bin2_1]MDE5115312.1 hypothetical protein [Trichodesmium sp. St15_bin1_1]
MQCNTFDLSPIESIANKTIKKFQPCCWANRVDQTRRNPVSTRNRVSKFHHLAEVGLVWCGLRYWFRALVYLFAKMVFVVNLAIAQLMNETSKLYTRTLVC